MALLLKGLDDLESEFAVVRVDFKNRMAMLHNELRKLQGDILSGQEPLPLEGVMDKVAEMVNSGGLDKDGVKCRAEVRHA
jgi:hypothetical protein